MTEEVKKAPGEESKAPETAKVEAVAVKETTVGDLLKDEGKKEPKMVPEAALLEYKSETKELKKELKDLRAKLDNGDFTKKEVSADLKSIADEFGISADAVSKLVSTLESKSKAEVDRAISEKLAPVEAKDKADRIEKIFSENFSKVLDEMPEFKEIANRDVIKSLSLDPKNANKTFSQIVEDSYGHLVKGKRTLEKTQNRGGALDTTIDFAKAKNDQGYLKEILSTPEGKKKYNEGLMDRLKL